MEENHETLVAANTDTNVSDMAESETIETQANQEKVNERLMIHKMVNENFKSYAGIQELGPFHKVRKEGF